MAKVSSVCVYCGSRPGGRQAYAQAARELGQRLARERIRLVYGGGHVGLMGIVADAALAAGGEVVGIIPEHLNEAEIAHGGLTRLVVVENMHLRKQMMFELSEAFVVLPGGLGTLEEAFEIITWRQLNLHDKPVFLVDVEGYWQPLLGLIDHTIADGFASAASRRLYRAVAGVEALFEALETVGEPGLAARPERL
ncbi:MAG: TIGR00730 family Rossman fold protein [Alphaproteobacteria bacterium]|jgi:hypothetical protein|nr:TIGR00730 family Rossman fold protein [Alphaproteobacteria bacterium]